MLISGIIWNMLYLFIFGDMLRIDLDMQVHLTLSYFGIVGSLTHSIVAVMSGGFDQYIPQSEHQEQYLAY